MIFPHANNETIDDRLFLAFWAIWFAGKGSRGLLDARGPVPRLNQRVALQRLENLGLEHGLDALCRSIVRPSFRNTMQATQTFMDQNSHLLSEALALNPTTGRTVNGAQLTNEGLKLLSEVEKEFDVRAQAEARLEIESNGGT